MNAVRLFLSSTFGDLARERILLDRRVFPRLQAEAAERSGGLRVVDLRWGISEAASRDRRTMAVCLDEVRRCVAASPALHLVLLLGDRYGWRPLPARVDGATFEALVAALPVTDRDRVGSAYRLDRNAVPNAYVLLPRAGRASDEVTVRELLDAALAEALDPADDRQVRYGGSATHLEVHEALTAAGGAGGVVAFARERGVDPPVGASAAELEDRRRLDAFDAALVTMLGAAAVQRYSVTDDPDLHDFGELVEVSLRRRLEAARAQARAAPLGPTTTAVCREVCAARTRVLAGPDAVTAALAEYPSEGPRTPLVVVAPPGGGRTTAMARALLAEPGAGDVVARVAGAVPEWTSLDLVLRGILAEVDGADAVGGIPAGLELHRAFARMLATPRERPLRIYLDGVDQLETTQGLPALRFVAPDLAPGVSLVLSAAEAAGPAGEVARGLRDLLPEEAFIRVPELSPGDAGELLDRWLAEVGRTLQSDQRGLLLARFRDCPVPLMLRLLSSQAARWRSFDEGAAGLGLDGVVRLGVEALAADADHGPVLVENALAYLGAARLGLSDEEMIEALSRDDAVMSDLATRSPHWPLDGALPYVIWARLRADLAPYAVDRAADGETLTGWVSQVVRGVLTGVLRMPALQAHAHLARLFAAGPGNIPARVLSERPFHLTHAQAWDDLAATLGDPAFLEAKCAAGRTGDLADDYRRAVAAVEVAGLTPGDRRAAVLRGWSSFVVRQRRALERFASVDGFTRQQIHVAGPPGAPEVRPGPGSTWLVRDGEELGAEPLVATLAGHAQGATDCRFSGSGALLVSSGMDGKVCLWSAGDGSLLDVVADLDASADSCDVSPDETLVASACADGFVRIHDRVRRTTVVCEPGFELGPRRCRFTPDGRRVVAVGRPGVVTYDVRTGARVASGLLEEIGNDCTVLDATTVTVGDCASRVHVVDLRTCRPREVIWLDEVRRAQGAGPSADGALLVVAGGTFTSQDDMAPFGEVDVVETATWRSRTRRPVRLDSPALNCAFLDPVHVAVGCSDGTLRVFDAHSRALEATHQAHERGVRGMGMSPDGRLLATAAFDGSLKIWDATALTRPTRAPSGQGLFAALDGSGRGWAVSATVDNHSARFSVAEVPGGEGRALDRPRDLADLPLSRRDPGLPMRVYTWDAPHRAGREQHATAPAAPGRHWLVHAPARMGPAEFRLLPALDPALWSTDNVTWAVSPEASLVGLVRANLVRGDADGAVVQRLHLLTYLAEPWGPRPLVDAATDVPLTWKVGPCAFSPALDRFRVAVGPSVADLILLPGGRATLVGNAEDAEDAQDTGPRRSVRGFTSPAQGGWTAVGYDDGLIRMFDADGVVLATASAHPGGLADCVSLGERILASIGADGTLRLWSAPGLDLLAVHLADTALAAVDVDPVTHRLLTVGANGRSRLLSMVVG